MNTSPVITPPPPSVAQPHGSVGIVFGVVAAIAVVGIISGVIGRLCGRRSIMGYGGSFDIEEWAEAKCSACIDGHVGPPPPSTEETGGGGGNTTAGGPATVAGSSAVNTGEVKTGEVEEERGSSDEEEEEEEEEGEEGEDGYHQNHQQRHSQVDVW